jgi:hypothetical protein
MADGRTRDWRGVGGAEWAVAEGAWYIPIRIAPSPQRPLVRQQKITMYDNRSVYMMQRYTPGGAYFQFRKTEFLQHYHKRSNVESTFSMMKRKFGDSLRSKTDVAMINETLCKIL